VVLAAALVGPDPATAQSTPGDAYAQALAHERALRSVAPAAELPDGSLQRVRAVVAAYEQIARDHPDSAYADNALWQAAELALMAYERFHRAPDLDAVTRALRRLRRDHPRSPYTLRAEERLRQFDGSSPLATIRTIRREVLPEVVRVTIELDREVPFHSEALDDPPRLFFDLPGAQPEASIRDAALAFDHDVVQQIRLGRHPQAMTRIVLDLSEGTTYTVFTLYDPYRVVIDCRHATTTADVLNRQPQHDIVRLLAARHAATCQCAAYLLAEGARA